MKKLLVYTTQLKETGGIESHLKEFCKQMHSIGVQIDLVVLNADVSKETKDYFQGICRNLYFGKFGRSRWRPLWLIATSLRLRMKGYQSIYTNGQGDSVSFFHKLTDVHGPWVHHHHTSGDAEDQSTWTMGYKAALNKADVLIACSKRNAADMEMTLQRRVQSIPCFSRRITVRRSQELSSDNLRLGYYGRLIPEKGIDIICKLSGEESLSNIEFHLWGEGEAYDSGYFKKYPNVYYHGSFNGEKQLQQVVSFIDGFLLLSVHPEGLPISLLEAMSAGLPWLATDRGGIPDIACDPLSTRVISYLSNYDQFKNEVIAFSKDLKGNKISRTAQIALYDTKYSPEALVSLWSEKLNIKTLHSTSHD